MESQGINFKKHSAYQNRANIFVSFPRLKEIYIYSSDGIRSFGKFRFKLKK